MRIFPRHSLRDVIRHGGVIPSRRSSETTPASRREIRCKVVFDARFARTVRVTSEGSHLRTEIDENERPLNRKANTPALYSSRRVALSPRRAISRLTSSPTRLACTPSTLATTTSGYRGCCWRDRRIETRPGETEEALTAVGRLSLRGCLPLAVRDRREHDGPLCDVGAGCSLARFE